MQSYRKSSKSVALFNGILSKMSSFRLFAILLVLVCWDFAVASGMDISHQAEPIAVRRGSNAAISKNNLEVYSNGSIICRIEVVRDPICLRFGELSSNGFTCDIGSQHVFYKHSGFLTSDEDCIKMRILLFFKDRTARKTIKIKVMVISLGALDKLAVSVLDVDRIGGSKSFGKDILPFATWKYLNSCSINFAVEKEWPANGRIAIASNSTANALKCLAFKTTYVHDGSYIPNVDYIPFTLSWKDELEREKEIRYTLEVRIQGAQKNEPPVMYSRRPRVIVKQYSVTQVQTSHLRAIDYKTHPSKLLLKISTPKRYDLGGYFATVENPGLPLEGITQDMINKGNVLFVAPKNYDAKKRRLFAIQHFYVEAEDPYGSVAKRKLRMMFFVRKFIAHYLSVVKNKPLHVLEGNYCKLSENDFEIACPGSNCNAASFSVIEDPKHGGIFRNSRQINRFSFADLHTGSLIYKHDDSENLLDNIIISVTDRSQLAFATLNVIAEPIDDSAPFLSVHKSVIAKSGQLTKIEPAVLKAFDPDTTKKRIMFKGTMKPKRGSIKRRTDNGDYITVNEFSENDLENGRIYYEAVSKEAFDDEFAFILSDGGMTPNLSKEYVVRVKILASDTSPPYKRREEDCIVRINEKKASVSLNFIDYVDNKSPSSEIVIHLQTGRGKATAYVQAEDVVIVNGYDRVPASRFTQQQLFHNKILFLNRFSEVGIHPKKSLQLDFVASDGDNNTTPMQNCSIVILPVDDKAPVISIKNSISVPEGGKVCINDTAIVLTDVDTNISTLTVALRSVPRHGHLVFKGRNVTSLETIDYIELKHQCLWYYHDDSESVHDIFSITASDGLNIGQGAVPIKINPVNDQRPHFVKKSATIKVMENSTVVIDAKLLEAEDGDSYSSSLTYYVIHKPLKGKLDTNVKDVANFTQSDLENDLLVYGHGKSEIGPRPDFDNITVAVCDDVSFLKYCSSLVRIEVMIVPVNSVPPSLIPGKELTVQEGSSVVIDLKTLRCDDKDTLEDDMFVRILGFPKHGFLQNVAPSQGSEESNAGKRITEFKCSDIGKRNVYYVQNSHKGFEPVSDIISMFAFDGRFNSTPFEVDINIRPVNDEKPDIKQIKVIEVQEGGWKLIDKMHIKITDKDIPRDVLKFYVTAPPTHGQLFYKCNGAGSPRLQKLRIKESLFFSQCALIYVHDNSETQSDTFHIEATDGKLTSGARMKIEVIPVNDQKPKILNNIIMTVRFGGFKNITQSYLVAQDLDTADKLLIYTITRLPSYGSLKLYRNEIPTKAFVNSTFTQEDINEKRLSYINHIMPVLGLTDSFKFSLSDGMHEIKNQTFSLRIRLSCRKHFKVRTSDVRVNGPKVVFTSSNLRAEFRKRKNAERDEKNIVFHIIKQPLHGVLSLAPEARGGKVSAITQNDLRAKRLTYRPFQYPLSKNDSLKFFVTDGKCMQKGKLRIIAQVQIATVKLMKRASVLTVVRRGFTEITPLEIRALDKFSPEKVIYRVRNLPANGMIVKDGIQTSNFSQEDINELRIAYSLSNEKAISDVAGIEVVIKDLYGLNLSSKPEKFPLKVIIKVPTIGNVRVITNEGITSLSRLGQNSVGTIISKRNLFSYNCSSKLDLGLRYIVIKPPVHGELILKMSGHQARNFTQADINEGRVIYKLAELSHTEFADSLTMNVEARSCRTLASVEFGINWSVVSLSDDVKVNCKNGNSEFSVNLTRTGYLNQGSVVDLHARSLTDASQVLPPTRIWFHPGDHTKTWKMPEEALEYEQVEVYINKEFNTLLGRENIKFEISKLQDACSQKRKSHRKDSTKVKAESSIIPDNRKSEQFHAISLLKTSPDKQEMRFKAASLDVDKTPKTSAGHCETGWLKFAGNCYLMMKRKMNWRRAAKLCKKRNATLYTPTSAREEHFVEHIKRGKPIWIGIKANRHGNWKSNVKRFSRIYRRRLRRLKTRMLTKNSCVFVSINWNISNCTLLIASPVCKKPASSE